MNILYKYDNGNTQIVIHECGTKIRTYANNIVPLPLFPDSIDTKITNYCDAGCSYCHEKSTIFGQHGDLKALLEVLKDIPAGTELALGGGNALEHPEFISFLREAKNRGWICNVTVNQKHLDSLVLPEVIKAGLVYGVGISVVSKGFADNIKRIRDLSPNVVFHVINGINKPEDVDWLCEGYDLTKVLLLGYKEFGRGLEYLARKNKVEEIKQQWLWKIRSYLGRKDLIMSFDNLAIKQTKVKRFLKQATWDKHFMGEEGQFSMYVDAIKQQYALTSTSEARTSFQDKSLLEFFKDKS